MDTPSARPHHAYTPKITPNMIFIWRCESCHWTLGTVKIDGVQIRFKGTVIEAVFPVRRMCEKCRSWNYCNGPEHLLTGLCKHDTLEPDDSLTHTAPQYVTEPRQHE